MEIQQDDNLRDAIPRDHCYICQNPFSSQQLEEKCYTKYRVSRPITIPDRNGVPVQRRLLTVQFKCDSCPLMYD